MDTINYRKKYVSVVGGASCSERIYNLGIELGKSLAKSDFIVICGGLGGIMEAVAKGVHMEGGISIGILPTKDINDANSFITYPIVTGLGQMRNFLVVLNGDIIVAIDGGYGTMSEISLALKIGKKVIAIEGWENVPGVICVSSVKEAMEKINELLENKDE